MPNFISIQNPKSKIQNPTIDIDYDLVIIGGGIVGATLAAALNNSGLKIAIIEAQPLEIAAAKWQAYAISILSGRIFQGIGVWSTMFPQMGKFRHIRLSDANYSKVVPFLTEELGTEFLGYVGEHRIILTALQEFIATCENVNWLCPAKVTKVEYKDTWAKIMLLGDNYPSSIRTKLVIAADGATSQIRQWAGIKTQGWKYWQSCVAFTIKHEANPNDIAFERFWPTGPMGILPLTGNRCQIVWTHPHTQAKALQTLDEKEFLAKLEEYTGGLLGKVALVSDRLLFPVQLMQSNTYIKHRLALIGDAAHCCHPVGGQGLNLGIRDAAALAQVLTEAYQQGKDIGDKTVLKCYESWRKQENLMILGFTDLLDRLFSNHWLPIVVIRRLGLWIMCHFPPLKVYALQLMTGLSGKIPQLAQK